MEHLKILDLAIDLAVVSGSIVLLPRFYSPSLLKKQKFSQKTKQFPNLW